MGQPPNPFDGRFVATICLLLVLITLVGALLITIFNSRFLGTFLLAFAALAACTVPIILLLIDRDRLLDWLQRMWDSIRGLLRRLLSLSGNIIDKLKKSAIVRFCLIIFLLSAVMAINIIYPTAPLTIHNMIFPPPTIHNVISPPPDPFYVDPKTGIGISKGEYQFLPNNYLGNPNNPEMLIYNENNQILASRQPYVTMVVVAPLTKEGRHLGVGYDTLQAAFVLQHEANKIDTCQFPVSGSPMCMHILLLVANAGDNLEYAPTIAKQIIQIAKQDHTLIGCFGFPVSTPGSIEGVNILTTANIPIISSTASSDALTAESPYFFRVAPVDSEQGSAAAQFITKKFPNAHHVLVLYSIGNPYSLTLASAFILAFKSQTGNRILSKTYDTNASGDIRTGQIRNDLIAASQSSGGPPDLIYFAGYSDDFNKLLNLLRGGAFPAYSTLPVFSGDGAYDLTGYTGSNYQGLYFTAFASPDEWGNYSNPCNIDASLNMPSLVKHFFCDYAQDFDPSNQHPGQYHWSRVDAAVMLSYDAATVLIGGYLAAYANTYPRQPSEANIQQAIQNFNSCNPLQGVSGQIAFGPDNNPLNKAIVLLQVANGTAYKSGNTIFLSLAQGQLQASKSQEC